MLESEKRAEAALYYLYMMSDGKVTYDEEILFDKICKELQVTEEMKRNIISDCKVKARGEHEIFLTIIRDKIDETAGKSWGRLKDKSSLAKIIWNLVNLGYADKDFSTNERKIVEYLINKWSIPKEIYIEFVDIAETILSLIQEREWIRKTFALGSERDKKEQNIEKDIKKLKKDVDLTIEELTM